MKNISSEGTIKLNPHHGTTVDPYVSDTDIDALSENEAKEKLKEIRKLLSGGLHKKVTTSVGWTTLNYCRPYCLMVKSNLRCPTIYPS